MTQELHTYVYIPIIEYRNSTNTCTPMIIVELFTIGKRWQQSKCLSTDNQNMDKQNVEYTYSRILFNHKKKFFNFYACYKCMYLEKHTYCNTQGPIL